MKFRVLRAKHVVAVLPLLMAEVKLLPQESHVGLYTIRVGAVNVRESSPSSADSAGDGSR